MGLAIIALGNYGNQYENTRHNIAWIMLTEYLKKQTKSSEIPLKSYKNVYKYINLNINNKSIVFVFPYTYMNDSGKAVSIVCQNYSLKSQQITLILDEYNFPLGKLHLKNKSSDGGHNGVKSVINYLNTNEFYKLRIGIEKKFESGGLVDYVLGEFTEQELKSLKEKQDNFNKAIDIIISGPPERAMQLINSAQF